MKSLSRSESFENNRQAKKNSVCQSLDQAPSIEDLGTSNYVCSSFKTSKIQKIYEIPEINSNNKNDTNSLQFFKIGNEDKKLVKSIALDSEFEKNVVYEAREFDYFDDEIPDEDLGEKRKDIHKLSINGI